MSQGHALSEGRLEKGCDICAHEIDFHKSLAVFTSPRANVVKVAWEAEGFKTRPAECTFWQRSGLVGKVMDASVRQLSKAYRPSCAPGASALLSFAAWLTPILLREQHSANTLRLNCTQPGATTPGGHSSLEKLHLLGLGLRRGA